MKWFRYKVQCKQSLVRTKLDVPAVQGKWLNACFDLCTESDNERTKVQTQAYSYHPIIIAENDWLII